MAGSVASTTSSPVAYAALHPLLRVQWATAGLRTTAVLGSLIRGFLPDAQAVFMSRGTTESGPLDLPDSAPSQLTRDWGSTLDG